MGTVEKKSRGQRGTVLKNTRGEDSPAKGYTNVRAPVTSTRRSHQSGDIRMEK